MTIRPGGMEAYADELFRAVREAGEFETTFVSRIGRPHSEDAGHVGTRLALADHDPDLYFFHTDVSEIEPLSWAMRDKRVYTEDWRAFLQTIRPDIVHFHGSALFGYDMIRETRRTLPHAAIVYTLHEFAAICHHGGQMVRTETYELCETASPRRCHECFPQFPAQTFFLRERFIKSALELVDMFIAPSEQLRRRYIEWGIPPGKIRGETYGRIQARRLPDPPDAGRRRRIGFFGRATNFKGVDLLLEAMRILEREDAGVRLTLWGANLDMEPGAFRERIERLLEHTAGSVRYAGRYEPTQLPGLMSSVDWVVVPSIWWENSPLVIDEAMMHRRPVICSGTGGMAEKVRNGATGLHFRLRDPISLAETIRRAVDSPELWNQLRGQITDPHSMQNHLEIISGIYRTLLGRRTPAHAIRTPIPLHLG
jgi:glycosyltransferase involved in cell wall biosynthesis